MITHIREWFLHPAAVRQEIVVEGVHLALMSGYHMKTTVDMNRLHVHIPECRSYTVEYRLCKTGEFEVSPDKPGNIGIRSSLDPRRRIPVCWLPRSYAGKRVDRYILMIDRKRVFYRAGMGYRRAA